jgi:hypothetical protein
MSSETRKALTMLLAANRSKPAALDAYIAEIIKRRDVGEISKAKATRDVAEANAYSEYFEEVRRRR